MLPMGNLAGSATQQPPFTFRPNMSRLVSVSLLVLLLLQSLGLPLQQHWCGGAVAEVNLLGAARACCAADGKVLAASGSLMACKDVRVTPAAPLLYVGSTAEIVRPAECCFDELQWEVHNVAASRQSLESNFGTPTVALLFGSSFSDFPGNAPQDQAGSRSEGSHAKENWRLPRAQARAYLQVFVI